MAIELFRFNNNTIELYKPEVLLVKEFGDLLEPKRNKCKEDPKGEQALRAFNEFAYIYLVYDWKSPYSEMSERDRKEAAMYDSGLTEEQLKDPLFLMACEKYRKLQDSRIMRLLNAAYTACDELEHFYKTVDLQERDLVTGKPIIGHKDVSASVANLGKVVASLNLLVEQVKKEQQKNSDIRGDVTPGLFDY